MALPDSNAALEIHVGDAGLVQIEELGQEVTVTSAEAALLEVATPPRFGQVLVDMKRGGVIALRRARPGSAQGAVALHMDCAPSAAQRARLQWVQRVARVEASLTAPPDPQTLDELVAEISVIAGTAGSAHDRALAAHLLAQTYLTAGRSSDASAAFDAALRAWQVVGDHDRALAALVARAEDLHRIAAYEQVLQATRSLEGQPDRRRYFSVRLENSRCLALHYLGRLDESSGCYQWTIAMLDELGESLELISTLQDFAQLERDRNDLPRAAELARQSLEMISSAQWDAMPGPDVPMVRGRVHRLLGDLAMRRGDVAEGLRQAQRSLDMFTLTGNLRWQGNTMLRIAAIYRELGAYDDAYEAITAAFARFNPEGAPARIRKDAPARIAAALVALAEVNLADGRADDAQQRSRQAASEFLALQMNADALSAGMIEAEAFMRVGKSQQARSILDSMGTLPPALTQRAALIESEIADATLQPRTRQEYRQLAGESRPLSEWMRAQIAAARGLKRSADSAGAQQMLESAVDHVTTLAWRARSPVLRLALERRRRVLRAAALQIDVSVERATPSAAAVWRWVMRADTVLPRGADDRSNSNASDFDRALAQSMLPPARLNGEKARYTDTGLERRLLAVVAAQAPDAPDPALPVATAASLSGIQQSLPADTLLLVLLDADPAPLILAITRAGSVVARSPLPTATLNPLLSRLKRGIVESSASRVSIDADAAQLSRALLAPIARGAAPAHLLVYAQEPFNGLPWSLLPWPGTSTTLIDSTAVSLVVLRQGALQRRAAAGPGAIHIVAADARHAGATALPELAGAAAEPALVLQGVRAAGRRTSMLANPTRHRVLQALNDSGAWVHIAAHGAHHPGYIGRSGIWLTSATSDQPPEILSWVEVLDRGVRADMVVLNACALAASSKPSISASVGFAEALVRAGAHDVVAALWPVSDTASTQWVAEFYRRLDVPQPTSLQTADAVRNAALRLRASRMFRHPSHWAALVHLTEFDVSASAPLIAARVSTQHEPNPTTR